MNRDVVEAHVHVIWLSKAKLDLGTILAEKILVVTEEDLSPAAGATEGTARRSTE